MNTGPLLPTTVLQDFLRRSRKYEGAIDGRYGPECRAAARSYVASRATTATGAVESWTDTQIRVAVEQTILAASQLYAGPIDGVAGSMTLSAAATRNAESGGLKLVAAAVGAAAAILLSLMFAPSGDNERALAATPHTGTAHAN